MGKFGIGARVVDEDSDVGTIVAKRKGEREVNYDDWGCVWVRKSDLSCLEKGETEYSGAAEGEKWVPKVGDRVRFTDQCKTGWWFGPHTNVTEGVISEDDGDDGVLYRYSVKTAKGAGRVNIEHIELIADPAPLKIEAGKFYRTRDGRKVGPLLWQPNAHENHRWAAKDRLPINGYTAAWREDGSFCSWSEHELDIVAEWVEPTVEPATLTLKAGATYRGESGVLHTVETNPDNPSWPFKTAGVSIGHGKCRFWQADGTAYNHDNWNPGAAVGDRLVELVEVKPKFKAGDKVRALRSSYCNDYKKGGVYEVREYLADSDRLRTVLDEHGSNNNGWHASNFELVEPHEFKVGDRVKLVGGRRTHSAALGTLATVVAPGVAWNEICQQPLVHLKWDEEGRNGQSNGNYYPVDFELVEPAASTPKFKVGDRVVIARNSRGYAFLKKEIGKCLAINVVYPDGSYSVDGSNFWWPEVDLDHVPKPTIPVGSTVTFTATGRLSAINENGHLQVTFPGLAPGLNSFALPAAFVSLAN